jgi:predicted PurR-regulated permease PerM
MTDKAPGKDITRVTLAVLFLGALIAASYWVVRPFLPALIWAVMIVIATWPLMLNAQARLWGRRGLAVTLMMALLLLVFVIPLSLAVTIVAQNTSEISRLAKMLATSEMPQPPAWLAEVPAVGAKLTTKWQQLLAADRGELATRLAPYAAELLSWFVSQVGNFGMLIVHFLLTLVLAAVLYMRGEGAAAAIRAFAHKLAGDEGERASCLAGQAIRAVALGIVVTALVQSIVAGVGLAVAGIPYSVLLTAIIFLLAVIQVGAGPVMIPTVIWLYWSGSIAWGTAMLVWTVLVFTLDNFLRPALIKKGANLPILLVFAGVIGGLIAFGIIGLFVGPVVLAVVYTLMDAWISDSRRGSPAY